MKKEKKPGGKTAWPLSGALSGLLFPIKTVLSLSLFLVFSQTPVWAASLDIPLTITERADVDRLNEPVTTGVPLPEGAVRETSGGKIPLKLLDERGKEVPAQFKVTSRWPDKTVRWLLLDFQASVENSEKKTYRLIYDPGREPAAGIKIESSAGGLEIDTGRITVTVDRKGFGIFRSVLSNKTGREYINQLTDTRGAVLEAKSEYSTARRAPDVVKVEEKGPLRTVVLIKGKFSDKRNRDFKPGVAGYTARIHFYHNQDYVRLFFTLENTGCYGFAHDNKPNQNYNLKEMILNLPLSFRNGLELSSRGYGENHTYKERFFLAQNHGTYDQDDESKNFNYLIKKGDSIEKTGERAQGWLEIKDKKGAVLTAIRYFWQNYPKTIEYDQGILSLGLWPLGGVWPPGGPDYRIRAGTRKSYEILLRFSSPSAKLQGADLVAAFKKPLMAMAPPDWYSRTKAFGLIAGTSRPTGNPALKEAFQRYEKLQLAKVLLSESEEQKGGDVPAMTMVTARETRQESAGWYGWMDFGDIPWGGNDKTAYSSGHYDWPYGMLLQFLRTGLYQFFDRAVEMTRHRYDIDQYHTDRGNPWYNNFAWNEFGNHDRDPEPWEPNPSHTWIQGLVLYYLLTGDIVARETALDVGRATRYYWTHDWGDDGEPGTKEIRIQGWSIENLLTLYHLTGKKKFLKLAVMIYRDRLHKFIGNDGAVGNPADINVYQPVLALEPMIKLDLEIDDHDLKDDILKLVNFFLNTAYRGGELDKGDPEDDEDDRYKSLYTFYHYDLKNNIGTYPALAYNFMLPNAFAYAYRITGNGKYRDFARRVFIDAVKYWQADPEFYDAEWKSPATFTPIHYPGSISKVLGWTNRYPQLYLYWEDNPKTDTILPGRITDLELARMGRGAVQLDWSAPGDDGLSGRVSSYQIKYSGKTMVLEQDWLAARNAEASLQPKPSGELESVAVKGLKPKATYYFVVRARDEQQNLAPLSNCPSIFLP
ncbi:MAG: fibronectin type III domain-containing protein [bacterium]